MLATNWPPGSAKLTVNPNRSRCVQDPEPLDVLRHHAQLGRNHAEEHLRRFRRDGYQDVGVRPLPSPPEAARGESRNT